MAEVLTESFCERCGSRYTFESARPRVRLRSLRVMSRGLKTFVLDDKTSLDEAMAAARSDTDRDQTSSQLDAFHKTFNFCMQCRQYTCPKCWNEAEGRCLTCAPNVDQDILAAPFPDLAPGARVLSLPPVQVEPASPFPASVIDAHATNGHEHPYEAGEGDFLARLDALKAAPPEVEPEVVEAVVAAPEPEVEPEVVEAVVAAPEPEVEIVAAEAVVAAPEPEVEIVAAEAVVAAPEPEVEIVAAEAVVAAPEPEVEPEVVEAVVAAPEPEVEVVERAHELAANTNDLFAGLRPGQSLADALDAFERDEIVAVAPEPEPEIVAVAPEPEPEIVAVAPEPEPEIVAVAPEPEPEIVAVAPEPEPEIVAVAPEPEPEIVAVAPEPEPEIVAVAPEPEPEIVAVAPEPERVAPPPVDVVAQPTWSMHAPDPGVQRDETLPAAATADPQWPVQPEWPTQGASPGLPFLNRPVVPTGGVDALWAESDRAVIGDAGTNRANAGVQPCVSCGLSLSASARFCRRCGSAQS